MTTIRVQKEGSPKRSMGRFAWLGAAMALGFIGCGVSDPAPPRVTVYPVKGTVLLADGKPLRGGHVYFVPTKDSVMISSGDINPDGSFSLTTGRSGEGAPAGEFKVRVEPEVSAVPDSRARSRRNVSTLPFPQRYADEDTSQILVTVKAEANNLEPFRLK